MSNKRVLKCPMCENRDIAKFQYGYPAYDEKTDEKVKKGKLILGGCCMTPDDPQFHCNSCNYEW